jgi:hypothetical protein
MLRFRSRTRKAVAAACLAAALAASVGCTHIEEGGIDAKFLRGPDQKSPTITEPVANLFPPEKGWRWPMKVTEFAKDGQANKLLALLTEEITNGGPKQILAESGYLRETYRDGKLYRHEVFRVNSKELALMAVGTNEEMMLDPPMPLLRIPADAGNGYEWEGQILSERGAVQASAYSRLTGPETVTVPAGKFQAWRIDTNLTAFVGDEKVSFPAWRWLAPGVGVVKEQYFVGRKLVVKELTRKPSK